MNIYPNGNLRIEYFGGIAYNHYGGIAFLDHAQSDCFQKIISETYMENVPFDLLRILLNERLVSFEKPKNSFTIIDNVIRGKYLSAPLSVHYYPSYNCNQKCFFCYNPENEYENFDYSKKKQNALELIDQCRKMGVVLFNILGGEPICNYNWLIEILREASPYFYCSFATNGSANGGITDSMARELAEIPNLDIRVSIQSPIAEVHNRITNCNGAFETAVVSIKNLVKYGISCRISCVPISLNIDNIIDHVRFAYQLGMNGFHLLPSLMTDTFNEKDPYWVNYSKQLKIINELENLQVEYGNNFQITYLNWYHNLLNYSTIANYQGQSLCVAGREIMEIDNIGNVYPCSMVLGNDEFVMGNIFDESMQSIWNSQRFNILRLRTQKEVKSLSCQKCSYLKDCLGGCPFCNNRLTGDINCGDPLCPIII